MSTARARPVAGADDQPATHRLRAQAAPPPDLRRLDARQADLGLARALLQQNGMPKSHRSAKGETQPPGPAKTDEDIREDVLCQLAWDDRLADHQLGVQVEDGVVTLCGVVDDWTKFNAAAEAAHLVAGVQDVANDILVKSASVDSPTDSDLAVAVRRALRWDARLREQDIRSTVTAAVVTLEGVVRSPAEQAEATRAVQHLHGVKRVENRLHIADPATRRE